MEGKLTEEIIGEIINGRKESRETKEREEGNGIIRRDVERRYKKRGN